jgi:outer membrane protein assembly factor BamB
VDQAGVTLAFDAATGREVWRTDRVSAGGQSPGVLGGTVFTGDSDPETHEPVILALDATTGDELWRTDREARLFFQGVSDAAEQVYAQAYEGDLVALDPDGGERWRVDPGTGMTWTSDGPAEAEGVLYAATNTGQGGRPGEDPAEPGVVALDPGSGEVIWRTPLGAPGGVWYGPVVAGDGLVVAPGAPPVPVLVDRGSGQSSADFPGRPMSTCEPSPPVPISS